MTPIFQIPAHRSITPVFALLIVLLAWAAFSGLSAHPLNAIGDDQETLHDLSLISSHPDRFFSKQRQAPIRPSVDLVLLSGYLLWGKDPAGYHLLLVGLHSIAALLLFHALLRLDTDRELALVSALLFFLNVAHFRSIQWFICINYIITFIFNLLTLIAYLHLLKKNNPVWQALAILALGAAVFSHPSGVAIVPFCAYLTWRQGASIRQTLIQTGPLIAGAIGFALAVYSFSPQTDEITGLLNRPDWTRLALNPPWYLSRLFTSAHWLTPSGIGNTYQPWEIVLGCLAILGALILYRSRIFPAADGAVWTLIMVLPFLNNPLERLTVGPSRQLYLASAGFSLVLAWALRAFLRRSALKPGRQKAIWAALLFSLTLLSIWHLKRAEAIDFWLVGRSHIAAGQFQTGITQYERAFARAPDLIPIDTYYSWVPLLLSRGESPKEVLQNALVYHPDAPTLHFLLGVSAFLDNTPDRQAEQKMQEALTQAKNPQKMQYGGALAFHNLAVFHKQSGRLSEAADLFQRALTLYPDYALARKHLSEVLLQMGQEAQKQPRLLDPQNK
ncbi:MAG: tetratricopeptide repeat protein [bacterium]|nr:tetratricopeptide repeat protein [bacterium]